MLLILKITAYVQKPFRTDNFTKDEIKNKPNVNIVDIYDMNEEQQESVYFQLYFGSILDPSAD